MPALGEWRARPRTWRPRLGTALVFPGGLWLGHPRDRRKREKIG